MDAANTSTDHASIFESMGCHGQAKRCWSFSLHILLTTWIFIQDIFSTKEGTFHGEMTRQGSLIISTHKNLNTKGRKHKVLVKSSPLLKVYLLEKCLDFLDFSCYFLKSRKAAQLFLWKFSVQLRFGLRFWIKGWNLIKCILHYKSKKFTPWPYPNDIH